MDFSNFCDTIFLPMIIQACVVVHIVDNLHSSTVESIFIPLPVCLYIRYKINAYITGSSYGLIGTEAN